MAAKEPKYHPSAAQYPRVKTLVCTLAGAYLLKHDVRYSCGIPMASWSLGCFGEASRTFKRSLANRVLKLDFRDKLVAIGVDLVELGRQAGDIFSLLAAEFAVFVGVGFGEGCDEFFGA